MVDFIEHLPAEQRMLGRHRNPSKSYWTYSDGMSTRVAHECPSVKAATSVPQTWLPNIRYDISMLTLMTAKMNRGCQ